MIIEQSGKNLKIKHDLTKPSINTKLALLSDKAEKEIGWQPNISIKEGIKKTIEWYNNTNGEQT
jgi:nucleoside-diphosphate-sugar epimerase